MWVNRFNAHRMKKKIAVIMMVLVTGGWLGFQRGWFGAGKAQTIEQASITAVAELRDIDFTLQISGDVQPATQLDVKPEVGGRLKAIHVEPGDVVKAGQLLVEIDDRDIISELESVRTEIEGAKLSVDKNKRNYARAKELFEQKLISKEAYDNLGSELDISENAFARGERKKQLVEDKLSKTKVHAPSDGTVLTVPVVKGQVAIAAASVNNGTTLMTVANLTKLLVESHVNQVDVAKLATGLRVKLEAESIKDEAMEAEIDFIAPVATVKSSVKGFVVQAIIEKPSARLRPGMTVQLKIPVAKAESVVSVPVSAVFKGDDNSRVVYVRSGEKTERRVVKVGISDLDHAEILQGLKEGEQVLLTEPERLGIPKKPRDMNAPNRART